MKNTAIKESLITDNALEGSSAGLSQERVAKIAARSEFGFLEFYELTGIDTGNYGIYIIDNDGVRLQITSDDQTLTARQRVAVRQITEKLKNLAFPCTPDAFCDWYLSTQGDNGISDFPLAEGFFHAVGSQESARPQNFSQHHVTSKMIIDAFNVLPSDTENEKWWDDRFRSAKRYKIDGARVAPGGRGHNATPSLWNPLPLAAWLIDKGHMEKEKVIHIMKTKFPEYDVDYLRDI